MPKKNKKKKKSRFNSGPEEVKIYNVNLRDFALKHSLDEIRETGAYLLLPFSLLAYADDSAGYNSLRKDEQKRKEFVNSYVKILDILLEDIELRKISGSDAEIIFRNLESLVDSQLQKYPYIRRELKKMRKEKEQKFNLFGIYVSEEESKRMDDRDKMVEEFLDARDKARAEGLAEGEQKKEKEIIFNMFVKGLDNETIIEFVPACSFEELEKLRKEWLESISTKKAD